MSEVRNPRSNEDIANTFLKLDCSNDPLTGNLDFIRDIEIELGVDAGALLKLTDTIDTAIYANGSNTLEISTTINATGTVANTRGLNSSFTYTAGTLSSCYPNVFSATLGDNSIPCIAITSEYDSQSSSIVAKKAGITVEAKGSDTGATGVIYGAWTQATNVGTGNGVGYQGYGLNTSAGTGLNAIGVYGYAKSDDGLSTGLYSRPFTINNKGFCFVGQSHFHMSTGSMYINVSGDPSSAVGNKTHILETDDGSVWIEKYLEVDNTAYFDATGTAIDSDGQVNINTDKKLQFRDSGLFIQSDSDGNLLASSDDTITLTATNDVDVTNDLHVAGEMKGSRLVHNCGYSGTYSASGYMRAAGYSSQSNNRGYVMPRSGSVVSLSAFCEHSVHSSDGTINIEVHKGSGLSDASVLMAVESSTLTGTNYNLKLYGTAARDTYTFSAGDKLMMYYNHNTVGGSTRYFHCMFEVVFDD